MRIYLTCQGCGAKVKEFRIGQRFCGFDCKYEAMNRPRLMRGQDAKFIDNWTPPRLPPRPMSRLS